MTQPDKLQSQLMSIFQAELEDHLKTLNEGLLSLEHEQTPEQQTTLLANIFRAAHSLKGAARAVEIKEIESIAHCLEDSLGIIQKEKRELTSSHFDILLAMVDAIRDAMTAHLQNETLPPGRLSELNNRLNAIMHGETEPAPLEVNMSEAQDKSASLQQAEKTAPIAGPSRQNTVDLPQAHHIPPAAGEPAPKDPSLPIITDETIRVATTKLDVLMDNLGELLVSRMRTEQLLGQVQDMQQRLAQWQKSWRKIRPYYHRLQQQIRQNSDPDLLQLLTFLEKNDTNLKATTLEVNALMRQLANDRNHLQLVTDDLQNGIRAARMLPISTLFDTFPRMVRDLMREQGKEITLKIEGTETEVDRQALKWIKDPLTHMLRNAVDHGIEPPDQREAAGKPRQGTIRLHAEQRGNNLLLEISDDGRGINLQAVRRAAVEHGLISTSEAEKLSERQTLDLIFYCGLTTAKKITDISGRGIGLDVVRKNLEDVHGIIQVNTQAGQGTTFTLLFPLTLATSQILLVRAGNETLGLPAINIERILRINIQQIGSLDGRPAIYSRDRLLPLFTLASILRLPENDQPIQPNTKIPVVILNVAEKSVALRVDGFLGTQEVVVKDLGRQLRRVQNIAGATILGDGQLVMVLNVSDLMKSLQGVPATATAIPRPAPRIKPRKIYVADDSITTRMLEKSILENSGYTVEVASDGQEAWDMICEEGSELPDLVISDVNMPNMDGFMLSETIKNNPRYAHIPVVLVTALESAQDKIRGMEAGADAYIVKKSFDQRELLEIIEQFIG